MHSKILILFASLLLISCGGSSRHSSDTPPSHELWDQLLKRHVNKAGEVDYRGFISDRQQLEKYLNLLSSHAPDEKMWSREEQLAYWINAYNAFTVKLIVDNYPTESIRDLGPALEIPGIRTVWHIRFFKTGGADTSLDEIEHDILRKKFDEPRIHFAINCASVSCPPLRAEAYSAEKLEKQLAEQAANFINDPSRNRIESDRIGLSKIFKWFKSDFTKKGSLIEFLNEYSKVQIAADPKVDYLEYDWRLNE